MIDYIPYKEILLLILGTLSTFLIWRVQHQRDKIRAIENQLSDKKYGLYSQLIHLVFDLMNDTKQGKEMAEEEKMNRMFSIKRDMFLYAPDIIFQEFTKWTLSLNDKGNPVNHFKIYINMMILIRKDMEQSKTKITEEEFMLFFMQSRDEYQKFKQTTGW